eukprot:6191361-Lingulodinium_polyedra.AAC.1
MFEILGPAQIVSVQRVLQLPSPFARWRRVAGSRARLNRRVPSRQARGPQSGRGHFSGPGVALQIMPVWPGRARI